MRFCTFVAALALVALDVHPAFAQKGGAAKKDKSKDAAPPAAAVAAPKGPKRYAVKSDRAVVVTRDVLVRQGFVVERVEDTGDLVTVWYYRGNMGRGRGRGPLQKMVIRRVEDRVVFEQAPPEVMVDIDVRLKL
ncbi:MAG: hypothetical protein HY700_14640 [Gemmatimonadetes bacterium]|nr:hypothetical protein [Gemmatimonadota bacterium]